MHTLIAPRRPDQASAVGAELLREIYAILRQNYDWVVVDTPPGFTAEVIDVDRPLDRHRHGRDARLALAEEHEARTRDARAHEVRPRHIYLLLNRAHSRVGISQSDVEAVLGRTPDVFIPSDREIPRTVNEGIPIVVACPQSEPAEAFGRLTTLLMAGTGRGAGARDGCQRSFRFALFLLLPPSALRKKGLAMELHERISSQRGPVREQEPFAELKNRVHMSVISELGRSFNIAVDLNEPATA